MKTLVATIAAATLCAAAPCLDAQRPNFFGSPHIDRASAVEMQTNVDASLLKVMELAGAGLEWTDLAASLGLTVVDGQIAVEVTGRTPNLSVENRDESIYGQVLTSNALLTRVLIDPAQLLVALDNGEFKSATAYRAPVANSAGIQTEGVQLMRAQLYHASKLTGEGVRIAVIDVGFGGIFSTYYEEAGKVQSMPTQADLDEDGDYHGTAMVEVIRDYAPDSQVLAIRLDLNMDIASATLHAMAWGADMIVCPLSWFELPGHGVAAQAAAMATAQGIMWVNAAGNFADARYWEGQPVETVTMGGHAFAAFEAADPYQFSILGGRGGESITVNFAYELGGAECALELYSWNGMSTTLVLEAQGNPSQSHQVVSHVTENGFYYFPMVRVIGPGQIGRMRMFSLHNQLHFSTQDGSIANPVGQGVISVGAVDAANYDSSAVLEDYSSRAGGIFQLSLNLCGPVNCTTDVFGSQGFSGTSAASAHIAGLLALQLADAGLRQNPVKLLDYVDVADLNLPLALVDQYENDNSPDMAHELIGSASGHTISPSNDTDWFIFRVSEASLLEIRTAGHINTRLFDEKLALISNANVDRIEVLKAGNYLIEVTGSAIGGYSLDIRLTSALPGQVETMSPGQDVVVEDQNVTLSWVAVSGIGSISYIVEVSESPDFSRLAITGSVKENCVNVLLAPGIQYYWRVTAQNQYGKAEPSDAMAILVKLSVSNSGNDEIVTAVTNRETGVVAGVSEIRETSDQDAAGCAGNSSNNGLAILLIALLATAGALRVSRRKELAA